MNIAKIVIPKISNKEQIQHLNTVLIQINILLYPLYAL